MEAPSRETPKERPIKFLHRRDLLKLSPLALALLAPWAAGAQTSGAPAPLFFDVRSFGATGTAKQLDTPAVNAAIDAAAAVGGGTVVFPAGTYLCFSVRLKSNVHLHLSPGAVIQATVSPLPGQTTGELGGTYDAAEPNTPDDAFQDYGHNHWHNSLLWGENLDNIGIAGPGLIYGKASPSAAGAKTSPAATTLSTTPPSPASATRPSPLKTAGTSSSATSASSRPAGSASFSPASTTSPSTTSRSTRTATAWTSTAAKRPRLEQHRQLPLGRRHLPQIQLRPLAPPVPPKTSRSPAAPSPARSNSAPCSTAPANPSPRQEVYRTGRLKAGTESNGGFLNITVSNCVFDGCSSFTLESEDGALCEDIAIMNITMRNLVHGPLFFRLGDRLRGPSATIRVGTLRRVLISNIVFYNSDAAVSCLTGIPGHPLEDIKITGFYMGHKGGGTAAQAALVPPELTDKYPDPGVFGPTPSQGFFLRHIRNLEMSHVEIAPMTPDARPSFVLTDVDRADFLAVTAPTTPRAFALRSARDVRVHLSRDAPDATIPNATDQAL